MALRGERSWRQRCENLDIDGGCNPVNEVPEGGDGPVGGDVGKHTFTRGVSPTDSMASFPEPGQTLIFLDWDDSLFPYSSLIMDWRVPTWQWYAHPDYPLHLPSALREELVAWREAVHEFLTTACSLSDRVVIVTNARRPWVEACIKRFAPNLSPLFGEGKGCCTVAYADEALKAEGTERQARDAVLRREPGSCFQGCYAALWQWYICAGEDMAQEQKARQNTDAKYAAMRREASTFYSKYAGQTWKNVISMGDMFYEYVALHELAVSRAGVAKPRERFRTKAVVLPAHPSVRELTLTLRMLTLLLPAIVHHDEAIDLDLRGSKLPAEELNILELEKLPLPFQAGGVAPPPKEEEVTAALAELGVLVHEHVAAIKEAINPSEVDVTKSGASFGG